MENLTLHDCRQQNGPPHINILPNMILEQIFRRCFIIDRLKCENVSRRWYWAMWELGWKGTKKFSRDLLVKGASCWRYKDFENKFIIAMFKRIGSNMKELKLSAFVSFPRGTATGICRSLNLLPNLIKMDIKHSILYGNVKFLPSTLLEIRISGMIDEESLIALAFKCPNLQSIQFYTEDYFGGSKVHVSIVNDFLEKYPRLYKLELDGNLIELREDQNLTIIGQLNELEELCLTRISPFNAETIESIANCQNLKRLRIEDMHTSEETLKGLARLQALEELEVFSIRKFTDSVLKAIVQRGKLRKLGIFSSKELTDDSILYLVERCKSLVTLDLSNCKNITEKTLEAVVNEVNRRYGNPVQIFPNSLFDKRIFYFQCFRTAINKDIVNQAIAKNPWLIVGGMEIQQIVGNSSKIQNVDFKRFYNRTLHP